MLESMDRSAEFIDQVLVQEYPQMPSDWSLDGAWKRRDNISRALHALVPCAWVSDISLRACESRIRLLSGLSSVPTLSATVLRVVGKEGDTLRWAALW
jgi:hypothetical protein